jgi:hypothetical protein
MDKLEPLAPQGKEEQRGVRERYYGGGGIGVRQTQRSRRVQPPARAAHELQQEAGRVRQRAPAHVLRARDSDNDEDNPSQSERGDAGELESDEQRNRRSVAVARKWCVDHLRELQCQDVDMLFIANSNDDLAAAKKHSVTDGVTIEHFLRPIENEYLTLSCETRCPRRSLRHCVDCPRGRLPVRARSSAMSNC